MFRRKLFKDLQASRPAQTQLFRGGLIESLEDRRMLSASALHHAVKHASVTHATATHASLTHAKTTKASKSSNSTSSSSSSSTTSSSSSTSSGGTVDSEGQIVDTIQFSQAPTAVQNGLKALASTDSLAAPTSTQTVYLGNSNGVETYTLHYTSSGTTTRITVDPNGNAVTQPVEGTTTWATLSGTGAGSNSKAAAEITAIATALGLTAPTATTSVNVSTASSGTATYTVKLTSSSSSSTTSTEEDGTSISVDSNGNPVGHESIPFSTLPSAIQNGLNNNKPSGATALGSSSTQTVDVLTANGVTFYSTSFTTNGTTTTVTVNASGTATSLPATTNAQFSTIPSAAQTELQTLATANGVAGTISSTQSVTVYNEGNGTTIYSVTLSGTNSSSQTINVTVSSDQNGNPTVPPRNHRGCGGDGSGESGGGGGWDFGGHGER